MRKTFKLAAGACVAVLAAALLLLTWLGEPYKHDGGGHTALYAGVRHVWRIQFVGKRETRREFMLTKGNCIKEGKSPGVCSVRAFGATFL